MLQLILAAREDETEFVQTSHEGNRKVSKGIDDDEIVANITHFFIAGKLLCQHFGCLYNKLQYIVDVIITCICIIGIATRLYI